MPIRSSSRAILAVVSILLPLASVRADLIVAENFDSYTTGTLVGQAATGTGLTGNYGTNGTGTFTVTAGSLAFSTYSSTDGNRLVMSSADGSTAVAKLDLADSPFAGTLYASYLVRLSSYGTTAAFTESRIASASNATGGSARFRTQANTSNADSNNLGVGYSSTVTNASTSLATAQAFMVIARYTNVGTALSGGTPGQATIFALSEVQWDNYVLSADPEAYLNTATVGTGAGEIWTRNSAPNETSSTFSFADSNWLQLAVLGYTGGNAVAFDEVRFGGDLQSVSGYSSAAVPEPGSLALARFAVAGMAFAGWKRRRKAIAGRPTLSIEN